MSDTTAQPVQFKAEIRQLLDILIHSLYSDQDIFLRELISNASDALNRVRIEMLTNEEVHDFDAELKIHITVDKDAGLLRITDTGIGMTLEELQTNLGTIAQSGAREFIAAAQENKENLGDIIGQFGVGFYSSFMVAESVKVISRSFQKDAQAGQWISSGDDTFTVEPAEKEERGTTIEIQLKEDYKEYAEEWKLNQIIRTHSDFVTFPIYVGEPEEDQEPQPVNQRTAVWRQSTRELDDEKYNDFYKQMTLDMGEPLGRAHVITDAPVQLYALLYVPSTPERTMFSPRKEDGLKLYARKVLIQEYIKELLPEYYRFVQGVVDSEDIPLNVSREMVQSSAVMARIKKVLTGRVTNMIKGIANDEENPDTYKNFWAKFGNFIKEGIATDPGAGEQLNPLLRFKTTVAEEQLSSLDDYVERMKPDQQKIYFLLGDDPQSMKRSPHLDYFTKHDFEVILLSDVVDSFMIMGIPKYKDFELQNIATADLELPDAEADEAIAEAPESLPAEQVVSLLQLFKDVLGERVADVRTTERLSGSVARLVNPEGAIGQEMERVQRLMDKDYQIPKKVLELNPTHATIAKLAKMKAGDALTTAFVEQIFENALLIEGLHPDPAGMINRIEEIMAAALK